MQNNCSAMQGLLGMLVDGEWVKVHVNLWQLPDPGSQARLYGDSYSSSRAYLVSLWKPSHANWAAWVLHDCNSSLIHPDLLLQNVSQDLVSDGGCSPGMQSESYGNQWLEDVLFTCCYNPQTKLWISFKHTVHCDLFKPKDMAYLKKKKKLILLLIVVAR